MTTDQIFGMIDKYLPYLNIAFYVLLCLPILISLLVGLNRGFKKGIWVFIWRMIYLVIFITTLNIISTALYNSSLFGLPAKLAPILLGTSDTAIVTLKDLLLAYGKAYITSINTSGVSLDTTYIYSLLNMVGVYAIKVVWTLIYFVIFVPILWIILGFFYRGIVRGKTEYRKLNKDPFMGTIVGILNGLVSCFILMVYLGGVMSLVSYTGELTRVNDAVQNQTEETTTSKVPGESSSEEGTTTLKNTDSYFITIALDDVKEGEIQKMATVDMNTVASTITIITESTARLKTITKAWDNNFLVSLANNVYIKEDSGTVDSDGKTIYVKAKALDKCFDEMMNMTYEVEGEREEGSTEEVKDLTIKVNFVSEINSLINSILYIVDDENIVDDTGKLDLSKLSSLRVESAFSRLTEINIFKVIISAGLSVVAKNYLTEEAGIDLTKSELNDILDTDYLNDLEDIGKVLGGLIDLGLGSFLEKYINGEITKDNLLTEVLTVLSPIKSADEDLATFNSRITANRKKISDAFGSLNLVKKASSILSSLLVNRFLNSFIETYKLTDNDINAATGNNLQSYKDYLLSTMNISDDIGEIVYTVFYVADWNDNESGRITYLIEHYKEIGSLIKGGVEDTKGITLDSISTFLNTILGKLSNLSFINAIMDVGVKFITVKMSTLQEGKYASYLTETNIFGTDGIAWKDELGEKIPNLVKALINADILGFINNEQGITSSLFDKATSEGGLSSYLKDTVEALFNLKLISNLADSSLKDLLKSYLSGLSSSVTIKISDTIGDINHGYKDEILNLLTLVDELLTGAKNKGATSLEDCFSGNLTYLLGGVSNIDSDILERSSILGPTIISFLSNLDNENISVPYIEADPSWNSTFETNTDGSYKLDDNNKLIHKTYGELYHIVEALKSVAKNDDILNLVSGDMSDTSVLMKTIKSIAGSTINTLFESKTIQTTISKLVNNLNSGSSSSFKIVVPSTSKEDLVISKYQVDEEGNPILNGVSITSDTLKDLNGEEIKVNDNPVKLATFKCIKKEEFKAVINALYQIPDISSLLDSEKMVSEIKKLEGVAVDKNGHETIYKKMAGGSEIKLTSRIEVMFGSDILRCTISKFLTGNDYNDSYFVYPDSEMELIDGEYYIKETSLNNLFKSIFVVLNASNIESMSNIDSSIVDNLLGLNDAKLEKLFESKILVATLSKVLIETNALSIPIKSGVVSSEKVISSNITTLDGQSQIEVVKKDRYVIEKTEFVNLFKNLKEVFTDGFDVDNIDPTSIVNSILENAYYANKGIKSDAKFVDELEDGTAEEIARLQEYEERLSQIFTSEIFKATLSSKIIELGTFVIPLSKAEEVNVLSYDSTLKTYSEKEGASLKTQEINRMLEALELIFPYKEGGLSTDVGSLDYQKVLSNLVSLNEKELHILFGSGIILGTLSNEIIKIDNLIVPKSCLNLGKIVEGSSSSAYTFDTERYFIGIDEAVNMMQALAVIFPDNVNLDGFGEESISKLINLSDANYNTINNSLILRATLSKFIIQYVSVAKDLTDKEVRLVADASFNYQESDSYIIKAIELSKLMKAMGTIFDGSINISTIGIDDFKGLSALSEENLNTIVSSKIINATLSEKMNDAFQAGSETEVVIPYTVTEAYTKLVYNSTTQVYEEKDNYRAITAEEIKNILKGMSYFDFDSLGGSDPFSAIKELTKHSKETGKSQLDVVLSSKVFHTTISGIILKINTSNMNIIIPETVEDNTTYNTTIESTSGNFKYYLTKDGSGNITKNYQEISGGIIGADELKALLTAFTYINADSFSSSGSSDNAAFNILKSLGQTVSILDSRLIIEIILESDIMRSTLSNYILLMNTDSFPICIPNSSSVFELNTDSTYEFLNIHTSSTNAQDKVYILKKKEMTAFILGASALDLTTLKDDPQKAMKSLSEETDFTNETFEESGTDKLTKIQVIMKSEILKTALTNYLISKATELGFTAIIFPMSVVGSIDCLSFTVSSGILTTDDSYKAYIKDGSGAKTEMEYLIEGLIHLDLSSMKDNTLSSISSLNDMTSSGETKLQIIQKSEILSASISSQIITAAGNGGAKNFYLPKQTFVLEDSNIKKSKAYVSINETTGVFTESNIMTLKKTEIQNLLGSLSLIDLNNIDSETLLALSISDLNQILSSIIVRSNIAMEFTTTLKENDNMKDYYNSLMEDDACVVKIGNLYDDANDWVETMSISEIKNLFQALQIMGTSKMNSFNISIDLIRQMYCDSDDTNDDLSTNTEDRVVFLRPILLRTLISNSSDYSILMGTMSSSDYDSVYVNSSKTDKKMVYKISSITGKIDSAFGSYVVSGPSDGTLTLSSEGILSWNASTFSAPPASTRVTYSIYINGEAKASGLTVTTFDISSLITSTNVYKIKVSGIGEIYNPLSTSWAGVAKPYVYEPLSKTVSATLSSVEDPVISDSDVSLTFKVVNNADNYLIKMTDVDNPLKIVLLNINQKYEETASVPLSVTVKLGDLLEKGHKYKIEITAKSKKPEYLKSLTIEATNKLTYLIEEKAPNLKIIDGSLYLENLEGSANGSNYSYTFTFKNGGTSYVFNAGDSTSSLYNFAERSSDYFKFNLLSLENNGLLENGTNTITVKTSKVYTNIPDQSLSLTKIDPMTVSPTLDLTSKTITFETLAGANKLQVTIYRDSETVPCLFKDIMISSGTFKMSIAALRKGHSYRFVVTPVTTSTSYLSTVYTYNYVYKKPLDAVESLKVSDTLVLTFDELNSEGIDKYLIHLVDTSANPETFPDKNVNFADFGSGIDLLTLWSNLKGNITYNVKVMDIALTTSNYLDSAFSSEYSFKKAMLDRPQDVEVSNIDGELQLSFGTVLEADSYLVQITYMKSVTDGKKEETVFKEFTLEKSTDSLIKIKLTKTLIGTLDDSVSYKVKVQSVALSTSSFVSSPFSVGAKINKESLSTPVNVSVNSEYTLYWKVVENADCYQLKITYLDQDNVVQDAYNNLLTSLDYTNETIVEDETNVLYHKISLTKTGFMGLTDGVEYTITLTALNNSSNLYKASNTSEPVIFIYKARESSD